LLSSLCILVSESIKTLILDYGLRLLVQKRVFVKRHDIALHHVWGAMRLVSDKEI
jgi:hypothetical protein